MSVNYNNLLKYFIFYFLFLLLENLIAYFILKIDDQHLNFILTTLNIVITGFFIGIMYYKFQFIENKKLYNKTFVLLLIIFEILLWIESFIFNKFLFYFIILNLILIFLLFFILIIYSKIFHITRSMGRTGDQSGGLGKV